MCFSKSPNFTIGSFHSLDILAFFVNDCSICSSFFYLFSLLSPRQSAPFEYFFVSENSSNDWLKQSFCDFFVRQSLSTYPKIEETIQILFLPGWYMADILCISLSYLLLFHCYYCLTGTKNDKTILAGKSIHLSFLWATL